VTNRQAAIHRDILAKNAVFYKKTKQIKKKAIRLSFFLNLMFSEEAAPATIHRGYFSKKCYNLQENKPNKKLKSLHYKDFSFFVFTGFCQICFFLKGNLLLETYLFHILNLLKNQITH